MAQQRKGAPQGGTTKKGGGAGRRQKQPTQRTPRQRVQVMGPTGKMRFEWRDWPTA